MRRVLATLTIFGVFLILSGDLCAAQGRAKSRSNVASGKFASGGLLPRGGPIYRYSYPYFYPYNYYYQPYYPPVMVISPYSHPYYVAPTVVATWPYFCVFHNEGYVSRIGLIDHLVGTHKIPLDAVAAFCPDDTGPCIFPSY
jgi:hypothetical protein